MLILIAESKTMNDNQRTFSTEYLQEHTPAGEAQAVRIMDRLKEMPQTALIAETGFSTSLAAKFRQMIYEFPNKTLGLPAIEAYTGVVFKALDYGTLPSGAKSHCSRDVRIISSLYGLVRPDDIIKPYRLDFTTKVSPAGTPLNAFRKKDVTIQLVKTLQDGRHKDILNLLPADAAKCIDWKIVKRFCKVWKADFIEITDGGKPKTPAANKLKTMRGKLLKTMLCNGLTRIDDLRQLSTDDFICDGTPVYPDHLQFSC